MTASKIFAAQPLLHAFSPMAVVSFARQHRRENKKAGARPGFVGMFFDGNSERFAGLEEFLNLAAAISNELDAWRTLTIVATGNQAVGQCCASSAAT